MCLNYFLVHSIIVFFWKFWNNNENVKSRQIIYTDNEHLNMVVFNNTDAIFFPGSFFLGELSRWIFVVHYVFRSLFITFLLSFIFCFVCYNRFSPGVKSYCQFSTQLVINCTVQLFEQVAYSRMTKRLFVTNMAGSYGQLEKTYLHIYTNIHRKIAYTHTQTKLSIIIFKTVQRTLTTYEKSKTTNTYK